MASADAAPSMHEECRRLQLSLQIASKLQQFVQTNSLAKMQRGFNVGQVNYPAVDSSGSPLTGQPQANSSNSGSMNDSPSMRQKPTPPPKRQSIGGTNSGNNSPTQTQVPSPTATHLYRIQAQGEDQLNQATDLFNSGNFVQASQLLDKLVVKYPEDPNLYVYALFCHYNLSTMSEMAMGPTVVIHSKETTCISRAVLLISNEQYSSANQIINNAMNEFPDSAALLALSGFVSLLTEEFHKASQVADKLATKKAPFASFLKKHVHFEQLFKKGLQDHIIDNGLSTFNTLKEALTLFPNSPKATVMLVLSAQRNFQSKYAEKVREFFKTLTVGNQVKSLYRAVEYFISDQFHLAHIATRELSKKDPYQLYFSAMVTSYVEGKNSEAIALAKEALDLSPNMYIAHHLLGYLYREEKDNIKAIHHYDKALQIQPHSVFTWVNKASIVAETEGPEKAIKLFETALKISPQSRYANTQAAENFHNMGKFNEAIALLEKFELVTQYFIIMHVQCYEESRNYTKALSVLNKYIQTAPWSENARLHFEKAFVLKQLEQYTSAMSSINTALELDSSDGDYYKLKAQILYVKENYQDALRMANKAIEKEKKTDFYQVKLQILVKLNGQYEDVLETSEKILEDVPTNPYALYQKAFALFKLDRNQEAFETSEELVNAEDDDGDNWGLLCLTAALVSNVERAKYAIRKARSMKCSPGMKDVVDKIEKAINNNTSSNNNSRSQSSSGGRRAMARQDYTRRAADEISLIVRR